MILIIPAILLLVAIWRADISYRTYVNEKKRADVEYKLSHHSGHISTELSFIMSILEGLSSFARTQLSAPQEVNQDIMDIYVSEIINLHAGILKIELTLDGIPNYVYPHDGSGIPPGQHLLINKDVQGQLEREKGMKTGEIIFIEPHGINTEDKRMTAVRAVYLEDTFRGWATMTFDIPTILENAGFSSCPDEGFAYGLRNVSNDSMGGDIKVFDFDPIIASITHQNIRWELGAVPCGGWAASMRRELFMFRSVMLAMASLALGISYLIMSRYSYLKNALEENEGFYKSLAESTQDAIFIVDLN